MAKNEVNEGSDNHPERCWGIAVLAANYKGPAEKYEASGDDLPRQSSERCYMSIKVGGLNSWPVSLQIVSSHGRKTLFMLLQEIDQVQIKIPVVLGLSFL